MSASTTATRTFHILTVAACGMACLLALLPAAGHDQMWLLYAARLMLHGAPLYGPQIFETNPPLILWLSSIPTALSLATHIPDTTLGKFLMVLLTIFIGTLCYKLLQRIRPTLSSGVISFLVFAYITIFMVMPARDFGQRDDFLIFFLLPYVFAAAVRAEGLALPRLDAFLIGALALCGVALKPHQILIPITVELVLLLSRHAKTQVFSLKPLLRPEILGMLVAGVTFLASIRLFAPFYFSTIVPLARDFYWAWGSLTLPQLIANSVQLHILLISDIALLALLGWRQTTNLIRILFFAGISATVAFYLQGTGWYYQQLPALSLLALAFCFLAIDLAIQREFRLPAWTPSAATALTLLALALTTHFMGYPFTAERSFPIDTPNETFFQNLPPGTPVMTISPTIDYTLQPIYKYHLTLAQRYPSLLMMPSLLRSEDPQGKPLKHHLSADRLAALDHIQRTDILEDLARWHPQLILVERCQDAAVHCQVLEDRHDNLLAWFQRDPAFVAAWQRYSYVGTRDSFDAYTLKPAATP